MKHFSLWAVAALFIGLSACSQSKYKVIVPVGLEEGSTVYLANFDSGETVDSAIVKDHSVLFTGPIDEPWVARILAPDGRRLSTFILEEGTIAINDSSRRAVGSMLNDAFNAIQDSLQGYGPRFQAATSQEEQEQIFDEYKQYMGQQVVDNLDSPIGYMLFMDYSSMLDANEMMEFVEQNPDLQNYQKVQNIMASAQTKLNTSAGKPFVDFTIDYNGKIEKLSDYVAKGQYCLVDFWASWCGPCRREIPVIKEIYDKWHDKGLIVLGVAVWDEPENTIKAIEELGITWPCIINAQAIPTDAYGISGIPCIILFGPDGVIVDRDSRGDQLKALVDEVMQPKK